MIAPFLVFLKLTPQRDLYVHALKTANVRSELPENPLFADTLVTEISKSKKDGKYHIRLIRDGKPELLPQCRRYKCELGIFIKKLKKDILSFPDVQKKCGVASKRRLLSPSVDAL